MPSSYDLGLCRDFRLHSQNLLGPEGTASMPLYSNPLADDAAMRGGLRGPLP